MVLVPWPAEACSMRSVVSISGDPWSTKGSTCEWVSTIFAAASFTLSSTTWRRKPTMNYIPSTGGSDSTWNRAQPASRKVS
jgi:hypothetical protein